MIPKVIHYCWVGGGPIPEKDMKCIESWKKFCPDYEIVRWDESNYDFTKNKYMKQAYENKKWGFVPDFARLDIIYTHGGIYLDTDVELVSNLDDILENAAFFGFEEGEFISPGLGFGAEKGHPAIKKLMEIYEDREFVLPDGKLNLTPSPVFHREKFVEMGAKMNDQLQVVQGVTLYPTEYFCPYRFRTGLLQITDKTHSIHRFNMSWGDEAAKKWIQREQKLSRVVHYKVARKIIRIISLPERVLRKLFK